MVRTWSTPGAAASPPPRRRLAAAPPGGGLVRHAARRACAQRLTTRLPVCMGAGRGSAGPRDSSRQPGPGSRQGGATRQGHTSGLAAAVGPQEGLPAVHVCPETGRVPRAVGGGGGAP